MHERRTRLTVVTILLAFSLLVGLTGFLASGERTDEVGLPAPRVGDTWDHQRLPVTVENGTFAVRGAPDLQVGSTRGDLETLPWGTGTGWRLEEQHFRIEQDIDPTMTGAWSQTEQTVLRIHHLGPGAARLATTIERERPAQAQSTFILPEDVVISDTHEHVRMTRTTGTDGPAPLCGHSSTLQGRDVPIDAPIDVYGACGADLNDDGPHRFLPIGSATLGDPADAADASTSTKAFVYRSATEPDVYLWFQESHPVPVQMVLIDPNDHEGHIAWSLIDHVPGEIVIETATAESRLLPPIAVVPTESLGPIDRSILDLPLTLEDAWTAARQDEESGTVAFLEAHPEAYLATAGYAVYVETKDAEEETRYAWDLVFSDGAGIHAVRVASLERAAMGALLIPDPTTFVAPSYEVSKLADPDGPFPAPDRLPTHASSLASAIEAYRTLPGARPVEAWGFEVRCEEACATSTMIVQVGSDSHSRDGTAYVGFAAVWMTHRNADLGAFDGDGNFAGRTVVTSTDTERFSITRDGAHTFDGETSIITIVDAPVWRLPTLREAAGAAFLALLAGFLVQVWPWLKGNLIGLFSREMPALEHPMRQEIDRLVRGSPGIHHKELMRRIGHGNHVTQHHVDRLVASGHITESRNQGYRCYFPRGLVDRRVMAAASIVKSDAARRILEAVARTPGRTAGVLATATGVAPATLSYHLKRLEQAGLVDIDAEGRERRVRPTELAAQVAALVGTQGETEVGTKVAPVDA